MPETSLSWNPDIQYSKFDHHFYTKMTAYNAMEDSKTR